MKTYRIKHFILLTLGLAILGYSTPIFSDALQGNVPVEMVGVSIDQQGATYVTEWDGPSLKKHQVSLAPSFTRVEDMPSGVAIDSAGTLFVENTPHGQIIRYKKKAAPETGAAANTILSSACIVGLIWKSLHC